MRKNMLLALSILCLTATCAEAKETEDAKVYSKGTYVAFKNGVPLFRSVNPETYYDSVPKEFEGRKIMLMTQGSFKPVEFKVKEAGLITLVVKAKAIPHLTAKGWAKVNKVSIHRPNSTAEDAILQKKFDVGNYSIPNDDQYWIRLLE